MKRTICLYSFLYICLTLFLPSHIFDIQVYINYPQGFHSKNQSWIFCKKFETSKTIKIDKGDVFFMYVYTYFNMAVVKKTFVDFA